LKLSDAKYCQRIILIGNGIIFFIGYYFKPIICFYSDSFDYFDQKIYKRNGFETVRRSEKKTASWKLKKAGLLLVLE
jgi:hypothetical protein